MEAVVFVLALFRNKTLGLSKEKNALGTLNEHPSMCWTGNMKMMTHDHDRGRTQDELLPAHARVNYTVRIYRY